MPDAPDPEADADSIHWLMWRSMLRSGRGAAAIAIGLGSIGYGLAGRQLPMIGFGVAMIVVFLGIHYGMAIIDREASRSRRK